MAAPRGRGRHVRLQLGSCVTAHQSRSVVFNLNFFAKTCAEHLHLEHLNVKEVEQNRLGRDLLAARGPR
eukprot:6699206-Prymnesium_polylepis.1